MKDEVYANAPQTIQKFKHNRSIIREIEQQLYKNVMRAFLKRVNIC